MFQPGPQPSLDEANRAVYEAACEIGEGPWDEFINFVECFTPDVGIRYTITFNQGQFYQSVTAAAYARLR